MDASLHDADYKSVKLLTPETPIPTVIIKQFLKSKQEFLDFKPIEKPKPDIGLK